MSRDARPEPITDLEIRAGARAGAVHRAQFSLAALLLVMAFVGIGCATIRWLGLIWLVPLGLIGLSAANIALAVHWGPNWRTLKPGCWHFATWLGLAAAASGMAVRGCQDYNTVAGTDKTPGHIVQISAAVLAGPMVGPIANPGAGEAPQAWRWTAILLAVLLIAAAPFLFVRRAVPLAVALICWMAFVAASLLWFFGAMISLGIFLS
jgi:hypothetical protein